MFHAREEWRGRGILFFKKINMKIKNIMAIKNNLCLVQYLYLIRRKSYDRIASALYITMSYMQLFIFNHPFLLLGMF
jgi:hypothetical protein